MMKFRPFFLTSLNVALVTFYYKPQGIEAVHNNALGSPPLFTSQHPNIYIYETDENGKRQDLILPCSIETPSDVNYTWFRGNQVLPGSMVNGEGTLIVPNITEGEYASRKGVDYYCIAWDNIGFDVAVRSRTISVYYAYFDGFKRMSENAIEIPIPVALASDVALECDVLAANPPPQIKWYDDQGEIQEMMLWNSVHFLDNRRYLYLRRLQRSHLERQYYCTVTNANLSQEILAPTRYVLVDNLTQGVLFDYKQIGDLRAFIGNISFEFAYVGGVLGNNVNGTVNALTMNGVEVAVRENIGIIDMFILPGIFRLEASVRYDAYIEMKQGTLTVNQIPRITSTFQDEREHHVGEQNMTYACEFEGFPLPSIAFYFNGVYITVDNSMNIIINNSALIIPSLQVSNSGIYQCIVSNEFGDDQAAWLLEISEPILPQVQPYNLIKLRAFDDRHLGALIVRDNGSTVSFSVDIVADPCPGITWIFNGIRLGPSNSTFMYNNPCIEASTRIPYLTFTLNVILTDATSGRYSANITNIAGATLLPKAYITVPEPISVVDLSLNDTCLKEGSSVSIQCNIRGFPRPNIEFHKNDIEITPGAEMFPHILIEFYDQIIIKNVTMNDEGLYSCTASDAMDNQLQFTQIFDFCILPHITSVDVTPNPHVGEPFFIECSVDGIPMPKTAWTKDGTMLEEAQNDHIRIVAFPARMSSRLEVSKARFDDSGLYQCNVSNAAGSIMHSFLVEVMQGGNDVVPTSLSLGWIIGITVGVTVLILVVLFIILVLVCVTCRLCYIDDKSSKSQIENSYSSNVAYLERLRRDSEQPEAIYPLYDTIPYSDPAQVQTKGGPTHQVAQGYEKGQARKLKRVHIYERIHEDVQLIEQPSSSMQGTTIKPKSGSMMEKNEIPVSETDDKDNPTAIIKSSYNEDAELEQSQKYPTIKTEFEQVTTERGMIKGGIKAESEDDDEPSQVYSFISDEHKAKKRVKMLTKKQEDQKEINKQSKIEAKMELKVVEVKEKECEEEEVKLTEEMNGRSAGHRET